MMVQRLGGEVIRGSSSHTGARALRDYYQALAHDGISPAITPGRTARAAVEVQAGRDSAGADVSAPDHPPGLCRLARVGHPVGPLRDPEALRPRCHRGRRPRSTSAKGSTPRGWPRCNWIWSETWKIFTGKHAVSLSKIGLTLNNTIAYLVFLISYARIVVYVPLSNLWENCVTHSHFSPVRVANY